MNTLIKFVETHGLIDRIFTDRQLSKIVDRSDARRYSLVEQSTKGRCASSTETRTLLHVTVDHKSRIHSASFRSSSGDATVKLYFP